jgi:hypothetical protein
VEECFLDGRRIEMSNQPIEWYIDNLEKCAEILGKHGMDGDRTLGYIPSNVLISISSMLFMAADKFREGKK